MLKFISVFLCLLCFQDEPVMSWSDSYRLTWSDFRAAPQDLGSAVATTASGITFGFSIKESNTKGVIGFTTNIDAHFYPEKSWYKPKRATRHVLGHEQLHFDITELHARKFRQRVRSLKANNNIKHELRALHKEILKELAEMQDMYDSETDFSRKPEIQARWAKFVSMELKKLEAFKKLEVQ